MKYLKCGDASGLSCDFEASGETESDVMKKMMQHGAEQHKEMMEKMSKKDKKRMAKKMEEMVYEK